MATGVIRIFLVPGTQRHEDLAADTAAFSGEPFGLGWLCEAKARSCLSQIHLFSETSESGQGKTECYSGALRLSRHLSRGGVTCWTQLGFNFFTAVKRLHILKVFG